MTEKFFDMENPLWQAVGRAGDLVVLSFLTILCSLPAVTAGASLAALYYAAFQVLEHGSGSAWRHFFHGLRQNLVQGVLLTLIFLVLGFLVSWDVWFMGRFSGLLDAPYGLTAAGWVICAFLVILLLLLFFWVFPLQARFYNPLSETLKNALVLSVMRLPKTMGMLFGDALLLGLSAVCLNELPQLFIFPILFLLPLCALLNAWILRDILGLEPGKTDRPVPEGGRNNRK